MKKDKKWFVDKWTKERDRTNVHAPMYHFINEFIADVNQLDEPEVLSQEWIDKHKVSRISNLRKMITSDVILVEDLQNLLVPKHVTETITRAFDVERTSQAIEALTNMTIEEIAGEIRNGNLVPKQELPVIPYYVADWVTKHREKYDLYPALKKLEDNSSTWELTYKWYRMNNHAFVNVYLTGEYEVEEEQRYNVELKVRSLSGTVGIFLYKEGDEVLAGDNFNAYKPEKDKYRLTEREIKDFDPRYWAFAKPVDKVDRGVESND